MLHLDARVHLDEVHLAVFIHQELDGARVLIADLLQATADGLADLLAHLCIHLQRRRLLDQLLVATLDRTLALPQRHDVPVLIGQHLKLNVPRLLDELLHVEVAIAEGVSRLGVCRLEEARQFFFRADDAHAAPASTRGGLEDNRIADRLRPLQRLALTLDHALRPGQDRHLGLFHGHARLFLFAHQPRHLRRRSDELDVRGAAHFGKVRVLRSATRSRDGSHPRPRSPLH